MGKEHRYQLEVAWTGNRGSGTSGYDSYGREHEIRAPGKPGLPGSSDPAFRGDPARWNPEELLVASLSACHMLWYLHLCADAGIVVAEYVDRAEGIMAETRPGSRQVRARDPEAAHRFRRRRRSRARTRSA